jgi:hypothetical protein
MDDKEMFELVKSAVDKATFRNIYSPLENKTGSKQVIYGAYTPALVEISLTFKKKIGGEPLKNLDGSISRTKIEVHWRCNGSLDMKISGRVFIMHLTKEQYAELEELYNVKLLKQFKQAFGG